MWKVCIGGTNEAKKRWPKRVYKHKSSAVRRWKQIHQAHDFGIAAIFIMEVGDRR